jgi:Cu(I)/Ag(I) efflux system membrane protein CusA/SilA
MYVETALGGMNLTTTIEGRERFSVNARFAQDYRNSLDAIRQIPVSTMNYGTIPLSAVSDVTISEGPPMINSENAMLRGTVLFNVRNRDLGSTVEEAQAKLNKMFTKLPKGYTLEWSGQWENQIHANKTLTIIIPIVLVIIFLILLFTYKSMKDALINMITVPFALIGGVYMVYFYHINISVAVSVGFIALFGVAVETGMLMTIYLDEFMRRLVKDKGNSSATITKEDLRKYIKDATIQRLRPILMTSFVSLFGLIPILWVTGTGTDVMLPITIPLIGGIITVITYVLFVTPVVFEMVKERELRKHGKLIMAGRHEEV